MIGIYKITNLINGHSYVGQSVYIERRWKNELIQAFNEKDSSYNYPLSRAFRKYGKDNFKFEVLEECSQKDLNKRERYWIAYYNTFYDGYNQTLGGDSGSISKPKEHIIGIITDLENTDLYHKEIAEKWGVSIETVQGINTGRYWFQENKNYPLQTKHKRNSQHRLLNGEVIKKKYFCAECGAPITSKATLCVKCAQIKSRKVKRPSKEELYQTLVNLSGNFSQASKIYGVRDNSIRKWCKAYGLPFHSADYKPTIEKKTSEKTWEIFPKKVAQIDNSTNEIINVYNSISDAYRSLGKEQSGHIASVCKGKRQTAYGYKWKYID